MVGLVIVSHSARLAEGVAELARGMAGPEVPLAATGGLDLPGRPLGTDASLVLSAIESVYSDEGVLVLMDLGSAILSAEMALEQLPEDRRACVVLCEAPLVEGALAAAVQIKLGGSLEQAAAEARGALAAKSVHLKPAAGPAEAGPTPPAGPAHELRLTVHNRLGLHARPAARFVQTASRYPQAGLQVCNLANGRGPASAKSINGVTTLGVRQGHEIQITATGPQAAAALAALQTLADENFGDAGETLPPQNSAAASGAVSLSSGAPAPGAALAPLSGLPASPGIAIGPVRLIHAPAPEVPTHTVAEPQAEWARLLAAIEKTRTQIQSARDDVARRADSYAAAIFEAHLLFLEDDALRAPARRAMFEERLNAAAAWQRAAESVAADYRALDDEYLRARAADVAAVGQQVVLNLLNGAAPPPQVSGPGVLVAADLTPAQTAGLDPALVTGICTAYGGPTSHSAILARALGIPAVVGLGEGLLALAEGTPLLVDGEAGRVWPNPDGSLAADYALRAESAGRQAAEARAASHAPAITRDGRRVEVAANIGSPADAQVAVAAGAEGVGLFRTEFLFLDRRTPPDEEEQLAAYRAAAGALAGRPLIIRTLDVGGDKPPSFMDLGREANPFLGWRAIRVCLAQPDFFKTQLRAILRTAADFPVKVMFPMIATLDEFRAARALLAEARSEARAAGESVPDLLPTGLMVEIPAAALLAGLFAREADFFSIGTNDLTQYTLAAERGNARVAGLADSLHPAVLRLIHAVVEAAHAHGKWVGVCGEAASDPLAVALLVGLGVDELSMSAPAIPRAKDLIRKLDSARLRAPALAALDLPGADDVRAAAAALIT